MMMKFKRQDVRVIRSHRLVLRAPTIDDAEVVASLAGDWDVASMTSRIPYPYTQSQAATWIENIDDAEFVRVIEFEGRLVGMCGYMRGPHDCAELGYWIGKPYWRQGFASEAAAALVQYCFARARFKRLTCCHYADNPASARVIKKLGFERTGSGPCWCEARRREVESVRYELRRPARLWRKRAA